METVSVLIPVYNDEKYIAQAVNSALRQQNVCVEVIVINDGSTDRTGEILQKFRGKIKVIEQRNLGHVKARNHGAKLATGKWLAFLDADDEWMPYKLAKQLMLAEGNVGLIYTDRENFENIQRVKDIQSKSTKLLEGSVFKSLLLNNFITMSSVLMRKDWFERLGGFDEELLVCEDWDLWLRFAAQGGIVKLCPEPLTRYRWRINSMTHNYKRMTDGRLKVLKKAITLLPVVGVSKQVIARAYANVWRCSAWYAEGSRPYDAIKWYLMAIKYVPWDLVVYKRLLKCLVTIIRSCYEKCY